MMANLDGRIALLAEEKVFGAAAAGIPPSKLAGDPRLAAERDHLRARLAEICAELMRPGAWAGPVDIEVESFKRLRDEAVPGWKSPLLALDPKDHTSTNGRRLFGELRALLTSHVHFPESWEYDLAALYIFQCYVGDLLPGFFYALIDGTKGAGKTTLLDHLSRLTDSLRLQSFTLATLSRSMSKFRPVSIDEFDVTEKNPDLGSATAALVRQGYKRDAAPRLICAPKSNEVLALEIAGPKALTFRYDLDDALKDRGFRFPMAAGRRFRLVVLGMAPEFGDLPARLKEWAGDVHGVWSFAQVCERIKEPSFEARVRSVLGSSEATRGAELMTTALIVSEVVGIDVTGSLRQASEARERESGASHGVEELVTSVRTLAARIAPGLTESEFIVLPQTSVRAEIDRVRKERHVPPLRDGEFARLRRDSLIQDSWRIKLHGYPHWRIPKTFLTEQPEGDSPRSPDSPAPQGERVSRVSQVSPVAAPDPASFPAEAGSWQEPAVSPPAPDPPGGPRDP